MSPWPQELASGRSKVATETFSSHCQLVGEILHSCQFTDADICAGKNVVVVGGGKSSIDCVVAAAKRSAKTASLVFRTPHWPVPRKLLNLVPFKWGTYSRFGHFMLPTHYDVPPLMKYIHGVLAPVKWLWWRIVETMFRVQATHPSALSSSCCCPHPRTRGHRRRSRAATALTTSLTSR